MARPPSAQPAGSRWQCPQCAYTIDLQAGAAPPLLRCPSCQSDLAKGGASTVAYGQDTQDRAGQPGPEELPSIPGFEILGVLGQGGMGVVYIARDLSLPRQVAIKTI